MRVISGRATGHKLAAPEGLETRPTTDRIKETLFNIISQEIYGSVFLDLFSGSGAIGIEALSRGAQSAYFVDSASKPYDVIEANLRHTKLKDLAVVYKTDVFAALKDMASKSLKFDIIFMDPPYAAGIYGAVFKEIVSLSLLNENGIIIAEHSAKDEIPEVAGLNVYRTKNFKTTIMSFLTLED